MKIRAVLFDMDGVLVDSEPPGKQMMFDAVALQGRTLNEDQWRSLLGATMSATKAAMEEWFPGGFDVERYREDWCSLMMDFMKTHGVPKKPYADEALAELRRGGCKLALCTSNTPEVVNTYLELAGWADAFDAVITGDLVTKSKPDPEIYLTAAQKLGVRPEECVGVEDSFNGIRSVRAAGMVSVMIPDLLPYGEKLAPYVDRHFDDLGGMMAWLNA